MYFVQTLKHPQVQMSNISMYLIIMTSASVNWLVEYSSVCLKNPYEGFHPQNAKEIQLPLPPHTHTFLAAPSYTMQFYVGFTVVGTLLINNNRHVMSCIRVGLLQSCLVVPVLYEHVERAAFVCYDRQLKRMKSSYTYLCFQYDPQYNLLYQMYLLCCKTYALLVYHKTYQK